jgi:hypothetical protein
VRDGSPAPLPDICELDGVVYSSQPTAVRSGSDEVVLERRRETITTAGERTIEQDVIHLDRLISVQLEREAAAVGLRAEPARSVPATHDYVGSEVVILRA